MRRALQLLSTLVAAGALLPAGCMPATGVAQVSGVVHLDDAPLAGAHVMFMPQDRSATQLGEFGGITGPDGKFSIALGSGTGKYAKPGRFVAIVTKDGGGPIGGPPPDNLKDEDRTKALMKQGPGKEKATLPSLYADRDRSPFNFEIKEGVNDVGTLNMRGKIQ